MLLLKDEFFNMKNNSKKVYNSLENEFNFLNTNFSMRKIILILLLKYYYIN